MSESILSSTKKMLGLDESYTAFDPEILIHINTAFSNLNQLGIGPAEGFMIEDKEPTWDAFLGEDLRFNSAKTFMYLKVRMYFDPPATSFTQTAMERQIQELEWRLNALRETVVAEAAETANALVWEIDGNEGFPSDAENGDVGFDPVSGDVWRNVE